jgi:hypothetical protein
MEEREEIGWDWRGGTAMSFLPIDLSSNRDGGSNNKYYGII